MSKKENLSKILNISELVADQILKIINNKLDPESFQSVQKWVRECYNYPSKLELKLQAINELLEGFGVEYVDAIGDTTYSLKGLSYINLGDTYTNTVIFNHGSSRFTFSSCGDIVESKPNKYL